MELKLFQSKCIDYLHSQMFTASTTNKKKIVVDSPTGSGKTIILINFIENHLMFFKDTIFVWFSPGKGNLEEQSKNKMEKFVHQAKTGNIFDVLNSGFEDGTTYFINWEMITNKKNNALKEGERSNLKERIKEANRDNKRFIIIIDEEHQNKTTKANDIISLFDEVGIIRASATPDKITKGELLYQVPEIDVINEGLITRAIYVNKGLKKLGEEETANIELESNILINKAVETRNKIANEYEKLGKKIRPLVLIQFPNMSAPLIEKVEEKLAEMGYTYENKMVARWFSKDSDSGNDFSSFFSDKEQAPKINIGDEGQEDDITKNDALPIFLLFKQAIATGWDCPRAKILVGIRENMNETFKVQTLGRLRRMPEAHHYDNDVLDNSYLYTFDEKFISEALDNRGIELKRVFLKNDAAHIILTKEVRDKNQSYVNEKFIRGRVYDFLVKKYNLTTDVEKNRKILENNGFLIIDKIISKFLVGKMIKTDDFHELSEMEKRVDVNTHEHGISLLHNIDSLKKYINLDYSKTRALFEILLLKEYKTKWNILELNNNEFYAFIINNISKIKEDLQQVSSLKDNQIMLVYGHNKKEEDFSIPKEDFYKYDSKVKNIQSLDSNVYTGYDSSMITEKTKSTPEILFEIYCENNKDVKFVYKNGDSGSQYFSIIYSNNMGKIASFYPDYVVELNDGALWIIETKGGEDKNDESKDIDINSINKFEALKNYANKHKINFAFVRDKNKKLFYNNSEYTSKMNEIWKPLSEIF